METCSTSITSSHPAGNTVPRNILSLDTSYRLIPLFILVIFPSVILGDRKSLLVYTLLYIKQITNNDLLSSTGNTTQYSVMTYMGIESKKEWM